MKLYKNVFISLSYEFVPSWYMAPIVDDLKNYTLCSTNTQASEISVDSNSGKWSQWSSSWRNHFLYFINIVNE